MVERQSRVEKWAKRVQQNIVGCENCQPIEQEEGVVWVDGQCTSIEDVLDWTVGVPDRHKDAVLNLVRCVCGNRVNRYDDVATPFAFEVAHERRVGRAHKKYASKLDDFAKWLHAYPFLGAHHAVGRALIGTVERFPKTTIEGHLWYRARRIEGGRVFTPDDLRAPDPFDVPISEGRYNHAGQAHWYLASTQDAALSEVLHPNEQMAWIQRWKVGGLDRVLDVVGWGPDELHGGSEPDDVDGLPDIAVAVIFGRYLNQSADRAKGWKPEYFLPRYLMDVAKLAGFSGIRYRSTQHWFGEPNLVIFDPAAPVAADGKPEIQRMSDPIDLDSPIPPGALPEL